MMSIGGTLRRQLQQDLLDLEAARDALVSSASPAAGFENAACQTLRTIIANLPMIVGDHAAMIESAQELHGRLRTAGWTALDVTVVLELIAHVVDAIGSDPVAPSATGGFRAYFAAHAELADDLYRNGHALVCYITASAALDALAEIWESDFPAEASALCSEYGGTVPSSVRMARFVHKFVPRDPRVAKIAVIPFAEDAKRFAPAVAPAEVEALLAARTPKWRGELPPSHLDLDVSGLAQEAPTLLNNPSIRRLAEEYQYPALLYSLYRCPTVHTFGWSKRSQGFVQGEEVMYMNLHAGFTSIGFGPSLVTNWLRASLDGYLAHCSTAGIQPAKNLDVGGEHERRMRSKWTRV